MNKTAMLLTMLLFPALATAKPVHVNAASAGQFAAEADQRIQEITLWLPTKMLRAFQRPIPIRFEKMGAHGASTRQGISLSLDLLTDLKIEAGKNRRRGTLFDRTVLHEIAHTYDQLGLWNTDAQKMRNYCQQNSQTKDPQCVHWQSVKTTVSTDPHYLGKAGWLPNLNATNILSETNYFRHRSPDEYELTNPQEHFAVNFEYFITDPEYKCRRPTLFQYLNEHFQHDPFPNVRCADPLAFADSRNSESVFNTLDVSRLYKIDYFFASQGKAAMSKWGHAMLRLVMCPPGKPMSDACYKDTAYHFVISYRAFIDTPHLNSWDGLTGKYPSRAFFSTLISVTKEYNRQELRDLESIPLSLTKQEMAKVVQRAIETHWSYSGKYYFKSNNCATETFNLLRSSLNRSELYQFNPLHPLELKQALQQSGMMDTRYANILADRQAAVRAGLLFESFLNRFARAFTMLGISNMTIDTYKTLPYSKRQNLFASRSDLQSLAAQIILEETTYEYKRGLVLQRATHKMISEDVNTSDGGTSEFQRLRQATGRFSAPYMLLIATSNDYGLPSTNERNSISAKLRENQEWMLRFANRSELSASELVSPEESAELKQTYENIELLNRQLKEAYQSPRLSGLEPTKKVPEKR